VCEGGDGTGLTDGDVLVFPDLVKYRYVFISLCSLRFLIRLNC
jgi:hypothetical protein